MSKRDWIEVTTSLIGGVGIGAALMYLFDPEKGDTRREHLRDNMGDAASATGEALGSSWQTVSGKARDWTGAVADTARHAGHYIADQAGRLTSHAGAAASDAGEWLGDAHDNARNWGKSALKSAQGYGRRAYGNVRSLAGHEEGPSAGSIAGVTAGVVGALALGAGLMFLFDPGQGRRRRAVIRDKAADYGHRGAEYAQGAAKGIAGQAKNVAGKVSSAAQEMGSKVSSAAHAVSSKLTGTMSPEKLTEATRNAITSLGDDFKEVEVAVKNGRVALTGSLPGSRVGELLAAVRGVQGVDGIDNQLKVQSGAI